MATKPLIQTVGRRKRAIARVNLRPGTGQILVNKQELDAYFGNPLLSRHASEALRVANVAEVYDVVATITGGGIAGQSGALRLGIARAIEGLDPEQRTALKAAGLMTRDPREVERKKPGQPKARKRFQFSKR